MKYYDEEIMRGLKRKFEEEVLRWPDVTTKKMFGCPCYLADKKLFAFLVTRGVVLTQITDSDRNLLYSEHMARSFRAGKRTSHGWTEIPVSTETDIQRVIPFAKKSYRYLLISRGQ